MASDFASRLHKRLLINIDKVKSSSEAPIWKKLRYVPMHLYVKF